MGKILKWNDKAIADEPQHQVAGTGTSASFVVPTVPVPPSFQQLPVQGQCGLEAEGRRRHGRTVARRSWRQGQRGRFGLRAAFASSIGYVEYAYAKQNKLTHVLLKNAAGNFVARMIRRFKAAAADADWNKSAFAEILTEQAGRTPWPITRCYVHPDA